MEYSYLWLATSSNINDNTIELLEVIWFNILKLGKWCFNIFLRDTTASSKSHCIFHLLEDFNSKWGVRIGRTYFFISDLIQRLSSTFNGFNVLTPISNRIISFTSIQCHQNFNFITCVVDWIGICGAGYSVTWNGVINSTHFENLPSVDFFRFFLLFTE